MQNSKKDPFASFKVPKGPQSEQADLARLQQQYEALGVRLEGVGAEVDDRGPLEKLLNLRQKQGTLGNIFEVMDRAGQTVKGGILGAQEGDIIGGAWQGLSGELDIRGAEFANELGLIDDETFENMGGVEKFVVNMVVDRIFDPLRLLPKGALTGGISKLNQKLGAMIAGKSSARQVYQTHAALTLAESSEEFSSAVQTYAETNSVPLEEAYNQIFGQWVEAKKIISEADPVQMNYLNKITMTAADGTSQTIDRATYIEELEKLRDTMGDAEKAEIDGFLRLYRKLEDNFKDNPNVKLIINKAADRADDIALYYRTGGADNGNWIRLYNIDAKYGAGFSSAGAQMQFDSDNVASVIFGDGVKLDPELQKEFMDLFNDVTLEDGDTLNTALAKIFQGRGIIVDGKVRKSLNFKQVLGENSEEYQKLKELFIRAVKDKETDVFFVIPSTGGEGKFVNAADLYDYMDFAPSSASLSATGKATKYLDRSLESLQKLAAKRKMVGYENLSRSELAAALKKGDQQFRIQIRHKEITEMFTNPDHPLYNVDASNDIVERLSTLEAGQEVRQPIGVISALAEGDTILKKPAEITLSLRDGIGRLFNANYDYSKQMTATLRRIDGETRQIIYHKNRTLMQMSEEAVKKAPNGEAIINELMETGARIEVDANGVRQVVVDVTNLDTKNLIDVITPTIKKGGMHHLPIYSGIDAKNITANLNTQFENATQIQNAFKIVEKNGQFFISLDQVDYDTFTKAMRQADFMGNTISIGRKQLSQEYMDFFLENEDLVNKYNETYKDIITIFDKELGPDNLPDFLKSTNGYSRHVLSKQGIDYLKTQRPLARSQFTREGLDLLTERTYIGTAEDVNKGLAAYYDLDFDAFDTDATRSLADLLRVGVIKNQSHRVLGSILDEADKAGKPLFSVVDNNIKGTLGSDYTYIDDFNAEFNKMMSNLSPEAQKMFDAYMVKQGFEKGKAIAINKTAYNTLKRIDNAYVEIPEWLKGYDKMMSIWKGFTLFTPGFHINNFAGNMTNSYLVGMDMGSQATYLPKAQAMLSQYNPLLDKLEAAMEVSGGTLEDAVKTLSDTDQDMFRRLYNFYNDGISMKMGGVRDLEPLRRTLESGGTRNLGQQALNANFQLAEAADDLQRFALYNWAYDKELAKFTKQGLSVTEATLKARDMAANTVMDTLFDYQQFTPFERDVMKRLVPFYTFMKNNIVFQVQNIVRNPGQYAQLGRAYESYIDDVVGLEDGDMPDYARDNMWIPLPTRIMKGDKESIAFLKTNLPPGDFAQFVENPFNRGVNSIAMPLKLPIELGMGRDTFTGQPLRNFPGEVSRMEPDTGVLAQFRDERGQLAPAADPIAQKILNDLGLRVPTKYIGVALDMADAAAGYKEPTDAFLDALQQLNIVNIKPREEINLIQLYRDMERLRNTRSLYEQQTRDRLPTQADLGIGRRPPNITFP
jgi:hypothetical protein